jgi:hypothetical protein
MEFGQPEQGEFSVQHSNQVAESIKGLLMERLSWENMWSPK